MRGVKNEKKKVNGLPVVGVITLVTVVSAVKRWNRVSHF